MRMVHQLRREDPADNSVISRVARQLGVGTESLRNWVKQVDIDAGCWAPCSMRMCMEVGVTLDEDGWCSPWRRRWW